MRQACMPMLSAAPVVTGLVTHLAAVAVTGPQLPTLRELNVLACYFVLSRHPAAAMGTAISGFESLAAHPVTSSNDERFATPPGSADGCEVLHFPAVVYQDACIRMRVSGCPLGPLYW